MSPQYIQLKKRVISRYIEVQSVGENGIIQKENRIEREERRGSKLSLKDCHLRNLREVQGMTLSRRK